MELLYDPANLALVVGLALLALDIAVIGLSPLMFFALGALAASALLYLTGFRPSLIETAALAAALGLAIALIGKKPLQRFQNADVEEDQSSDLIGRELTTTHEVTKSGGTVHWSGVDWRARLAADAPADRLAPGVRARVTEIENLVLVLTPVSEKRS
ncbi:NfeD family protein [Methylosinus sp. Sm6]|uniref:NfeD family protein n=1 Tax=Methylosinus sp. Sm6 TaxID=2866948 RepID=UPI001C990EF0|nr:NfeD family protein [Methylosinus sp. Sm6]MBY6240013.1 NfeD family protein [Methylosinus sp. Sm6]